VIVDLFQTIRQPTDLALRPIDSEIRETIEDTRHRHLQRRRRLIAGKTEQQGDRVALILAFRCARKLEYRSFAAKPGAPSQSVGGYREIWGGRRPPKLVVIRRRVRLAAGKSVQIDTSQSNLGAVLHFRERVIDAGIRNDAHWN